MNNFYSQRKILAQTPAGQGLLEAMLAIGLILMGLGAVLALTLKNISAVADSGQRIVAANLAREAIDVARGIRDSNWLKAANSAPATFWDDGLVPSAVNQGARAILTLPSSAPDTPVEFTIDFVASRDVNSQEFKLYRDGTTHEWYQGMPGFPATGFQRMILLDPICATSGVQAGEIDCGASDTKIGIRIQVQVAWQASGIFGGVSKRQLSVEEYLYNWR